MPATKCAAVRTLFLWGPGGARAGKTGATLNALLPNNCPLACASGGLTIQKKRALSSPHTKPGFHRDPPVKKEGETYTDP